MELTLIAVAVTSLAMSAACMGGEIVKANYALWTESSLTKITRSSPTGTSFSASISAARGEHEAFQVALRAGRVPLEQVRITVSDLSSDHGTIPASAVSLYLQPFIYLPRLLEHYPDPLPPLTSPIELQPGRTLAVWVDVGVPRGTAAGDYSGVLTVTPANGATREVRLSLRVYDFDLPEEPKIATAFGLLERYLAEQHGLKQGTPEARAMHQVYYEFLLSRGISTYTIPADLESDEGAKYLTDRRMTSFVIPYTTDKPQQTKTLDRIRSLGAWDMGFFYVVDEPVHKDRYDPLVESCEYLRGIDPEVHIVSPYFRGPEFTDKSVYDLLAGHLDIWCFNTAFYHPEEIDKRREAGDIIWNYVCCGPGKPYANFFVEYAPLEHRMLFWQNYFHRVSGLLYWCTNWWNDTTGSADPWNDAATVKDINPTLYGDGSLLYPGSKVGIEGPVSSVRLEIIRDGIEDYSYLWLLEQKKGRERVQEYVSKLAQSWTEYSTDPAQFREVRDAIARDIEGH